MIPPKPKVKGHDILAIDLMQNGRYRCTLYYEYAPLFPIRLEDLEAFVHRERPVLARQRGCQMAFSLRKGQKAPMLSVQRKDIALLSRER